MGRPRVMVDASLAALRGSGSPGRKSERVWEGWGGTVRRAVRNDFASHEGLKPDGYRAWMHSAAWPCPHAPGHVLLGIRRRARSDDSATQDCCPHGFRRRQPRGIRQPLRAVDDLHRRLGVLFKRRTQFPGIGPPSQSAQILFPGNRASQNAPTPGWSHLRSSRSRSRPGRALPARVGAQTGIACVEQFAHRAA
jgi:hypothetical protein